MNIPFETPWACCFKTSVLEIRQVYAKNSFDALFSDWKVKTARVDSARVSGFASSQGCQCEREVAFSESSKFLSRCNQVLKAKKS